MKPFEKVIAGGFALALLLLSGIGVASYLSIQRLTDHKQRVDHTYQVLEALHHTLQGITEAESGRRGYIIAKKKIYLSAYKAGVQKVKKQIESVHQLTVDNPVQQRRLAELEPLIAERLSLLQRSIDLFEQNQLDMAAQVDFTEQEWRLRREVQTRLEILDTEERNLLQQRSTNVDQGVRQTVLVDIVGYCLSFGLLAGVYFLLQRQIRVRYQAEAALHQANERLETRVQERTTELAQANASLQAEIIERRQAEQALQQAKAGLELKVEERTAELKRSNQDLVRSNQELEQFAYVASHDLQEPLRAVIGFTQLLLQDYQAQFDHTAQEYAAYIVDGAKRMQQLIQDLLLYSRVGARDLLLTPTDCNAVLSQVRHNLQVAIAETNATLTQDALPTVDADKNQLTQLLQNLIANAIKFHREDPPQIHISVALQGNEWRFGVHDQGIGIKPRYLQRIFEIFKRLHTRTEFPGTGIGLAICKKIVDRHGGQIWAESEPGVGTVFYFTVPHHEQSDVQSH